MSQLSISKHYQRVLRFLIALSDDRVSTLLALRGFGRQDAERGWTFFNNAAGRNIACERHFQPDAAPSKDLLIALDKWENVQFDVAEGLVHGVGHGPQRQRDVSEGARRLRRLAPGRYIRSAGRWMPG